MGSEAGRKKCGTSQQRYEKKQIRLGRNIEKVVKVIKKQVEKGKPIENILPEIRTRDDETLGKAIVSANLINDTDKGRLFKNVAPDFIFRVVVQLTVIEQVTILRQIEQKKREDILLRYPLSQRARLECDLKKT